MIRYLWNPGTSGPAPASGDTTIRMGIPEGAAIGSEEPSVRLPDDVRSIVEALPAGCALLVVPHGPHAGARFLLDTDTTSVGRHPRRDILLDDATVSRNHAEFVRQADGFAVHDLNSLNGTYVNGQRVAHAFLRAGDQVRIGKFRLVYYPSPTVAPPPDPDTSTSA